jgi:hypothetical protein
MTEWAEEAVGPMMGIWVVVSLKQNATFLSHLKG